MVKNELIAKELVMSERHQVKLVKIEIFGVSPASPKPVIDRHASPTGLD